MSSKRAAGKVIWELFKLLDKAMSGEPVFKSYAQMHLRSVPRSTYNNKLKRFERYGLVQKKKTGSGQIYILSPKAKFLRRKAVSKRLRRDGFATLIIFDIPQAKNNARDTFRRYLVRSGYTQLRESCFISPFQISQDLKDLARELNLEKNISFFSAKPENYL